MQAQVSTHLFQFQINDNEEFLHLDSNPSNGGLGARANMVVPTRHYLVGNLLLLDTVEFPIYHTIFVMGITDKNIFQKRERSSLKI